MYQNYLGPPCTVPSPTVYYDNRSHKHILFAMDNLHLILLNFCKAFNTVHHHRLLLKLQSYGITNKTHTWITSWLTQRVQRVVIRGAASGWLPVKSGVPQGTVLGPLMFLIYINDIDKNLSCCLRLFADDCLLYHVITSKEDCAKSNVISTLNGPVLGK